MSSISANSGAKAPNRENILSFVEDFFSIEDLQIRAKLSGSVIEILRKNGVLDGLSDTDQMSFF